MRNRILKNSLVALSVALLAGGLLAAPSPEKWKHYQKVPGATFTYTTGCSYTLSTTSGMPRKEGGAWSVELTTQRNCPVDVTPPAEWMTFLSSGPDVLNGENMVRTLNFRVAGNDTGMVREGDLRVGGTSLRVIQPATPSSCPVTVAQDVTSLTGAGGRVTLTVQAGSTCTWCWSSLTADVSKISGPLPDTVVTGPQTLVLEVKPNSAITPRDLALNVAGTRVKIHQTPQCKFEFNTLVNWAWMGGSGTLTMGPASGTDCFWGGTAVSSADWVQLYPQFSGSGPTNSTRSYTIQVSQNLSPAARKAIIQAGDNKLEITQESGGLYALSVSDYQVNQSGRSFQTVLTTSSEWSAVCPAPWVHVTPQKGTGTATLTVTVDANAGSARSAEVHVGALLPRSAPGEMYPGYANLTVRQLPGISFSQTYLGSASGGQVVTVNVQAASGVSWSVDRSLLPDWVQMVGTRSGPNQDLQQGSASGTGYGTIYLGTSSNPTSGLRFAYIQVEGYTLTLAQERAASYTLGNYSGGSSSASVGKAGGEVSIPLSVSGGGGWSVLSSVPWITLNTPQSGCGTTTVRVQVAPNTTGASRQGFVWLGGKTFTITQSGN